MGKAMHILEEVGKAWATEHRDDVLEPPQVQGILSFDETSVSLRLVVKVRSSQKAEAEWELRRRIKEAFDREAVEVPFPRRVFYTQPETDGINGDGEDLRALPQHVQKVEETRDSIEAEAHSPTSSGRGLG